MNRHSAHNTAVYEHHSVQRFGQTIIKQGLHWAAAGMLVRKQAPGGFHLVATMVAPGWLAASLTFYLDGAHAAGPGGRSLLLLDDLAWWPPLIPGGSNRQERRQPPATDRRPRRKTRGRKIQPHAER